MIKSIIHMEVEEGGREFEKKNRTCNDLNWSISGFISMCAN